MTPIPSQPLKFNLMQMHNKKIHKALMMIRQQGSSRGLLF